MAVLVAAASKHGATHEIAETIGRTLETHGVPAEVVRIDDVEDASGFDAFVLGSAVYVGQWLQPAREFIEQHAATLSVHPTWLFSSGPLGDPPRPDEEHAVRSHELVTATRAREHRLFPGKLDRSKLGFGERAIVLAVRAADGDYRDWNEIEAWAATIASALGR
jgi:menaquinone-dependent protoporphyrinogen oxidase